MKTNNNKYDIIICGAGPAGVITAIQLARESLSVLLLDKEEFPRDKICGDQLPPSGTELLYDMNILDDDFFKTSNSINNAEITSAEQTKINFQFEFLSPRSNLYIIPRERLDNQLVEKAIDVGVNLIKAKVVDYSTDNQKVIVNARSNLQELSFTGKMLIAADGSNSTINRLGNEVPSKTRGIAIRAYVSNFKCDSGKIEGFFLNQFKKGYAWIFPLSRTEANIGLGMDITEYLSQSKSLKKLLKEFLQLPDIESRAGCKFEINSIKAWPLNIGPPNWDTMVQNRLVKVGDAAGLIMPVTGGGIVNALLSGKLASEIISQQIKVNRLDKKSLSPYIKLLKKEIGRELFLTQQLQKFVSYSPKNIEFLLKLAKKYTFPYILMNKVFSDVKLILQNK